MLEYALWALGCSLYGCVLVAGKLGDDIAQEKQKNRLIQMRNLYRNLAAGKHLTGKALVKYAELKADYGRLRNVWHTFAAGNLAVPLLVPAVVYAIFTADLLQAAGLLICTYWPWTMFGPGYNHFTGRELDYRSDRGVDRLMTQVVDWFQSKFKRK